MGRVQAPQQFSFCSHSACTLHKQLCTHWLPESVFCALQQPISIATSSRELCCLGGSFAKCQPFCSKQIRDCTAQHVPTTRQGRFAWSVEDLSGRTRRQCPPLTHHRHNRGGEQRPSAPTSVSCHHASRRLDVALVAVDQPMAVPQLPELAAQARNASTAPAAGAVTVLPPNYAGLARGAASQQALGGVPMLKPVACLSPSLNLGCGGTLHAASPSC